MLRAIALDGRALPLKLVLPPGGFSATLAPPPFLPSPDNREPRAAGSRLPLTLDLPVPLPATGPRRDPLTLALVAAVDDPVRAPTLPLAFRAGLSFPNPVLPNVLGLGGPEVDEDDRRKRVGMPDPEASPLLGLVGLLAELEVDGLPLVAFGRPNPKAPPPELPELVRGLGGAVEADEAPLPDARVARLPWVRVGLVPLDGGRPPRDAGGLLRLSCREALPSSTWLT